MTATSETASESLIASGLADTVTDGVPRSGAGEGVCSLASSGVSVPVGCVGNAVAVGLAGSGDGDGVSFTTAVVVGTGVSVLASWDGIGVSVPTGSVGNGEGVSVAGACRTSVEVDSQSSPPMPGNYAGTPGISSERQAQALLSRTVPGAAVTTPLITI